MVGVERLIGHFLFSIEGSFLEVTSQGVSLTKHFGSRLQHSSVHVVYRVCACVTEEGRNQLPKCLVNEKTWLVTSVKNLSVIQPSWTSFSHLVCLVAFFFLRI